MGLAASRVCNLGRNVSRFLFLSRYIAFHAQIMRWMKLEDGGCLFWKLSWAYRDNEIVSGMMMGFLGYHYQLLSGDGIYRSMLWLLHIGMHIVFWTCEKFFTQGCGGLGWICWLMPRQIIWLNIMMVVSLVNIWVRRPGISLGIFLRKRFVLKRMVFTYMQDSCKVSVQRVHYTNSDT